MSNQAPQTQAAFLVGVWHCLEDDRIVVYAARETWSFAVGDIHYTGEPCSVTTWFVENGELVTRERAISDSGVPSPDEWERRFAIELDGDDLSLTDLDLDGVQVLRRERDPALVATLSQPIIRRDPMTRHEPRLGTLR